MKCTISNAKSLLFVNYGRCCQSRAKFMTQGRRTSFCRYSAAVVKAKANLGTWAVELHETIHICLELDMVYGKKLMDKITLKPGLAEYPDGKTSSGGVQFDGKTLRSCCQNGQVVKMASLGEPDALPCRVDRWSLA